MKAPLLMVFILLTFGTILLFLPEKVVVVSLPDTLGSLPEVPEFRPGTSVVTKAVAIEDIPPAPPLPNPPSVVKAVYLTSWSAGSSKKMRQIIDLLERTELNGVVIDVKDYSGYVAYATGIPEVKASGAEKELKILRPNALLKELHDHGIYAVARITVFQDPVFAEAHPELALADKTTGGLWKDRKGLAWLDPAAMPVWDYVASIAQDALRRGFDEVNLDYIRFASDGDLEKIYYPFWNELTPPHVVIRDFFRHLRDKLGEAKISADLFGLSTVNYDDLGIGQVIEDAYQYFDYVSPMVYPSHYAPGFLTYKNPAQYPYEVIRYSIDSGLERLIALTSQTSTSGARARLRPWLQDFNLGAIYDAEKVRAEIRAVEDAIGSSTDLFSGWYLWNPANNYTEGALKKNNDL